MLKQTIKKLCLKSTVLYKHIFFPYSIHCEKRRQYLVDENNYRLNDAEYCLRGIEREKGVNFWFLLEQGHNNIGDIAIGIAERRFFEKYYPGQSEMIVDFWMPNKAWEGCDVNDPSARVLSNYGASGE